MDPMPPVVPQAAWSQGRSTSGEEMEQAAGAEPRNRWAGSLQSLPRWCRPEYESAIHIPSRPRTAPCQFPPALGATLGDIEYQRLWDSRIVCMYVHPPIAITVVILWLAGIHQDHHGDYRTAVRTHLPLFLSSIALSLMDGRITAAKRKKWIHRINSNRLSSALAVGAFHWHAVSVSVSDPSPSPG